MSVPWHNFEVGLKHPLCLVVFVYAILTLSNPDVQCPNPLCKCENRSVTCTHISYIPPLPDSTKALILNNSYLHSLSRNSFSNITNLKLRTLQLLRCEIQDISSDALDDFTLKLDTLDLSGNIDINRTQLSLLLKELIRMKVLFLNQINMGFLESDFFKGMENSELGAIHLQNNKFHDISDQAFKVFQRLKNLDLSNNVIYVVKLSGLDHLEDMKLNSNMLDKVPDFCVNGLNTFPKLKILRLDKNSIDTLLEESWSCLTSLKELHLDGNRIKHLDDNAFSQFKKLNMLSLQSMRLENISRFAFNNSNLKSLFLCKCCIEFTNYNFDYANLFKWCPNLQTLALDKNNLCHVNNTSLMSMLSPLNKLMYLSLRGTQFRYFPADFFKPLISLSQVDLTSNRISEWPRRLFSRVGKLRKLLMANNKIKVIKEGYLPSSLTENLTTLDLSANPFDCSCENLWLRKWMNNILRQNPHIFTNSYPKSYKCITPSSLEGTLLMNYNPTDEVCRPWSHALIDIIIISSAGVIVFSCVAVLYIQRWNIRYLLHVISLRNKKYTPLKEADFQYDIYVAYSDKDRPWIRNTLWRELQQEKGFKLFIRDKCEDPGVARCDSIVNNMYCSRKIILIISPSFMSCPWCQYQLQVAQGRAVHVGSDWLIPVVLGDLKIRHVTKSLYVLLKHGNVITWSEEENGKKIFWSKLIASIENDANLNDFAEDDSLIVT